VALPQKCFSFTPGFSPVQRADEAENRFNGFPGHLLMKPLKRFLELVTRSTGLKPGVNEKDF